MRTDKADPSEEEKLIALMRGGGYSGYIFDKDTQRRKKLSVQSKFYPAFDDSSPPDESYFRELQRVSKYQIIWGGNFFGDYLGRCSRMIVWDKKRRGLHQADCEIAWTNLKGQNRIFEFKWNGMLQEDMKNKEKRVHAAQKPVALYKYLLNNFAEEGYTILDTHVGSASSLIACEQLGFEYVGFELSKTYYDIATKRMQEYRETGIQMTLDNFFGWR